MNKMLAYCGITCTDCDAYRATQSGDQQRIEAVAASWRESFNPNITAKDILCDGCLATTERLCSYCAECHIRACAQEKQVANCAHCGEYEDCGHLKEFFSHAPEMKKVLDGLRAELSTN